jgi:hypothetical protein
MERVDLTRVHGETRHDRWRHGWEYGPFVTHVAVGELDDGRWFAERHGRAAGICARARACTPVRTPSGTRGLRPGGGCGPSAASGSARKLDGRCPR